MPFFSEGDSLKEDLAVSGFHCIHLTSVDELRAKAAEWDDLWRRSDIAMPTVRAEILALWMEQFAAHAPFHVLAIADQQRWIAALPLTPCRVGWLIPAGGLPCNPWISSGDLLLDPAADVEGALETLLTAVGRLPWPLLWFNETVAESPRWQEWLKACSRAEISANYHEHFRSGRVAIRQGWDAYQKQLPKNHRQAMHRFLRRLTAEGDMQFEMNSRFSESEVEPWLRTAFETEDRGWKGDVGTSVLHTPGMFDFFTACAKQLARWGQLETAALRLDGQMLAFVYGFRAKGVYFAHKIGYDPQFAHFSPGQLLFYHILEQLHRGGEVQALDFLGPLTQSLSRWRPTDYGVGRVAVAPRHLMGRAALYAYQHWLQPLRHQETANFPALPAIDNPAVLEPVGNVS